MLSAKLTADEPTTALGQALTRTRSVLFGRPLASEADITERLPKWKALPVFYSDSRTRVTMNISKLLQHLGKVPEALLVEGVPERGLPTRPGAFVELSETPTVLHFRTRL